MDEKESKPNILREAEDFNFSAVGSRFEAIKLMVVTYSACLSAYGRAGMTSVTEVDAVAMEICRLTSLIASGECSRSVWVNLAALARAGAVLQGFDKEPDPDQKAKDAVMEATVNDLQAENVSLRKNNSILCDDRVKFIQALGLLTSIHPQMAIDIDDPVGMAKKIEKYVNGLQAENERPKDQKAKEAVLKAMREKADGSNAPILKCLETARAAVKALSGLIDDDECPGCVEKSENCVMFKGQISTIFNSLSLASSMIETGRLHTAEAEEPKEAGA